MKKILIIDDDPGIQELLKIIFEMEGYAVAIESNAQNILENKFSCPDIFLLDRYLSGVDGLEVCRKLKADSEAKNIPVIMLSASPDISKLAVSAGAEEFLEKPFDVKHLVKLIKKYI